MQPLQLYTTPLQGLNLIEASAGTGKTFTIAALYLRMIIELGISVEHILVVTYTKAATAELRERIRLKLVETRIALDGKAEDEQLRRAMQLSGISRELASKRLQHALLGFDRAAIFTIHGFCQRVLADNAFAGGLPFETELITEQSALVQEVVDDFWRLQIQQLSPGLLDYLFAQGVTPDSLALFLRGNLGKPYVELRGCAEPAGLAGLEADFIAVFGKTRDQWLVAHEAVGRLLLESPGLNRNRYRKASLPGWLSAMAQYLTAEPGTWMLISLRLLWMRRVVVGRVWPAQQAGPPRYALLCTAPFL